MIGLDFINGNSRSAEWIREHLDYPRKDWCLLWPFSRSRNGYAYVGKLEQCRNKSNTYTPEEDRIVRDAVTRGLNFKQAAELIGKSHSSVIQRAFRIGLKSGFRPRGRAISPPDGNSK